MFSQFVILSVAKKLQLSTESRMKRLVSQAKICSCGQQQRKSRQPRRARQLSHPLLKPTSIFFLLLIYVPAATWVGLPCLVCVFERKRWFKNVIPISCEWAMLYGRCGLPFKRSSHTCSEYQQHRASSAHVANAPSGKGYCCRVYVLKLARWV